MLAPAERRDLAHALCARVSARYPGDVVVAGLYGSAASGADTPWSDLDLLCVTRAGSAFRTTHLVYQGTAVELHAIEQSTLEALLVKPSVEWPYWMGVLEVLRTLHGEPRQVRAWLEMGQSMPEQCFREALIACVPALVVESHGRIHSCRARGNGHDIGCAVIEVLFEMRTALCLLNRRWVTHDYYQGLVDSFAFPALPRSYRELVPVLWMARDMDEIARLADVLVDDFRRLLTEQGISVPEYQAVADIPL